MFDRILILQHKGGEYIAINISSVKENREIIGETLNRAEEKLIKPSTTSNVALQVLDSRLSPIEIEKIVVWLQNEKLNIFRLAIIGAKFSERRLFNKFFKKHNNQRVWKFIDDWERAKDWLVGGQLPEG